LTSPSRSSRGWAAYFFFLRFLRSRRFLEPIFRLRLGFGIYYLSGRDSRLTRRRRRQRLTILTPLPPAGNVLCKIVQPVQPGERPAGCGDRQASVPPSAIFLWNLPGNTRLLQ